MLCKYLHNTRSTKPSSLVSWILSFRWTDIVFLICKAISLEMSGIFCISMASYSWLELDYIQQRQIIYMVIGHWHALMNNYALSTTRAGIANSFTDKLTTH